MGVMICENCGKKWWMQDREDGEILKVNYCSSCPPYIRDREGEAEAGEAATERARANYYQNLCNLQGELICEYRSFLLTSNPSSLSSATPREWDLGQQVYMLQKDNEALRELSEEYRKTLEEYAAKIN